MNDFRATIIGCCRTAIEQRNSFSWEQKVLYHYPPDIESNSEMSQLVADRLSPQVHTHTLTHLTSSHLTTQNSFTVSIHASTEDQKDLRYVLSALPSDRVPSLLEKAVRRFNRAVGKDLAEPQDYILKVCGAEEYLLGDYPLIQYKVSNCTLTHSH